METQLGVFSIVSDGDVSLLSYSSSEQQLKTEHIPHKVLRRLKEEIQAQ